jgi:sulfur carrier protein
MQVIINGESKTLTGPSTVAELLKEMNIDGKIAVEINREILPRSRFEDCHIKNGDVLEIVQAIGGG